MRAASVPCRLHVLVVVVCMAWGLGPARAGDVRDDVKARVERAKDELDAGIEAKDAGRIQGAREALAQAKTLLAAELGKKDLTGEREALLRHDLVDLDVWLGWAEDALRQHGGGAGQGPARPGDPAPGAGGTPDRKDGARFAPWLKTMRVQYEATESGVERAILAQRTAAEAGIHAVPCLLAWWKSEADAKAREGVHDALATIGTSRVAQEMARYARRDAEALWPAALDVIYRALAKPERNEPEKPWCGVIREFHGLKERKLSLRIQERLDAMGYEGTAALGELLYVEDIGYHDYTIGLLAKRKDRRAVPPLVFKLNRFAFEAMEQMPAHKALLQIGWYGVPELIDHLDDKAAGIWISWTLRKITGETMGTDKRKWHDWWKHASVQHPELFDDPEERPGGAPATGPTTPSGR